MSGGCPDAPFCKPTSQAFPFCFPAQQVKVQPISPDAVLQCSAAEGLVPFGDDVSYNIEFGVLQRDDYATNKRAEVVGVPRSRGQGIHNTSRKSSCADATNATTRTQQQQEKAC